MSVLRSCKRAPSLLAIALALFSSLTIIDASVRRKNQPNDYVKTPSVASVSENPVQPQQHSATMKRRLQAFDIAAPNSVDYSGTLICPHYEPETAASRTTVRYRYTVETALLRDQLPADAVEVDIPKVVSAVAVDRLSGLCDKDTGADGGSDGANGGLVGDGTSCYVMVTSDDDDEYVGECPPTESGSQGCFLYSGSVEVVHTSECLEEDVIADTTDALMDGMESEVFVGDVNDGGLLEGGIEVTDVDYLGEENDRIVGVTTLRTVDENGLTNTGIAMIALLALMLLLLLLCCCCWWQAVRRRREKLDNDCKSLHTAWPSLGGRGGRGGRGRGRGGANGDGDNSMMQPDFRDLGLVGSNMNVHHCTSAFCQVCNHKNLGEVNMVPTAGADLCQLTPEAFGRASAKAYRDPDTENDSEGSDYDANTADIEGDLSRTDDVHRVMSDITIDEAGEVETEEKPKRNSLWRKKK